MSNTPDSTDDWIPIADAARIVGRSKGTIHGWVRQLLLTTRPGTPAHRPAGVGKVPVLVSLAAVRVLCKIRLTEGSVLNDAPLAAAPPFRVADLEFCPDALKYLRTQRGLTATELADLIQHPIPAMIGRWESGHAIPGATYVLRLLAVFAVQWPRLTPLYRHYVTYRASATAPR